MRPTVQVAATLAAAWGVAVAVNRSLRVVEGGSMRPTLRPADLVLTVPVRGRELQRGDVVVAGDPREPRRATVKRVEALAGDPHPLAPDGHVPPGHVWLRGDDPTASTDSAIYGPVPIDLVSRRVVARVWPPGRSPTAGSSSLRRPRPRSG